jgi:hypothetical protein
MRPLLQIENAFFRKNLVSMRSWSSQKLWFFRHLFELDDLLIFFQQIDLFIGVG